MFWKILVFSIITLYLADTILGKKLINIYECWGIFGKPGSGKTTLLCKYAYQHQKKGWKVYADFGINIPGIQRFEDSDLKSGKWLPDGRPKNENILVIIDEIGTLYNNRDFKTNFSNTEVLRWWKEHRHRHVKIIYCSQFYKDMDSKIRPLTDKYFICKRSFLNCISFAKPILTSIDITNSENSDNAGGQIIDIYKYGFFTSWQFILLPRWIKKFNSFS